MILKKDGRDQQGRESGSERGREGEREREREIKRESVRDTESERERGIRKRKEVGVYDYLRVEDGFSLEIEPHLLQLHSLVEVFREVRESVRQFEFGREREPRIR